jgi:hypothetical protein
LAWVEYFSLALIAVIGENGFAVNMRGIFYVPRVNPGNQKTSRNRMERRQA